MARDPDTVDEALVAGVRAHTQAAGDAEIRAALASLTSREEKRLRRMLRDPPPGKFGPFAWADLARGTDAKIAAARELSGYYTLLAERDALASLARKPPAPPPVKARREAAAPRTDGEFPAARPARTGPARSERAQHLLGLFAYHRDAPLVARSLRVALADLNEELELLGIRRRAYGLTRGTDAQMPRAAAVDGPSGPSVRRRARAAAPEPAPAPAQPPPEESESAMLRALLAEAGPRRTVLAARLGTSGGALLARFRAAGLEREFALRERDLIRALWSKHRGSEAKVAAELETTPEALRDLAVARGLARELEGHRDRLRREALRRRWPRDRIEQVLHRRDELQELGVLDGLQREVEVRAGVIWNSLRGKRDALDLFAKKLRLTRDDALRLQKLLHLS
jgi:hypothetical protein